jgi:ABC-type branched-subunit amino acid transport system ATPase component/ABC-type branched-subunit amino acid transport system permease subunit
MLVAVAVQRRRFGRAEAAARTSSWEAAATPRPLPWSVLTAPKFRSLAPIAAIVVIAVAAFPPLVLSPSDDVLYATSAALAIRALAVGVAWMFAGEVALGHWGLAGLGAAVAAVTPGPWIAKGVVTTIVMTIGGGVLALAARYRSALTFAVLGLGAAAAAEAAVLTAGKHSVPGDPGRIGMVAGALAIAAMVAMIRLRSSRLGAQLVAARDDPGRAPWLGVDPIRSRIIALAISGGLAGLAGALYIASTPAGIAPGAFDPYRSLDILAMAVVGGIGSPIGTVIGVATIQGARLYLSGPWSLLATGAGVLVVVLFLPGGLSRAVEFVRDSVVRRLLPGSLPPRPVVPSGQAGVRRVFAAGAVDPTKGRLAGSDTREAFATPAVRLAAVATALVAGTGWAAIMGAPSAWREWIELPSGLGPWFVSGLIFAAGAAAIIGWRQAATSGSALGETTNPPLVEEILGAGSALTMVLLGVIAAITGDSVFAALSYPFMAMLAGWVAGQAARIAVSSCVKAVVPAVGGIIAAATLLGLVPSLHIAAVRNGSGLPRAGGWSAVYAALAAFVLLRAKRAATGDRSRTVVRAAAEAVQTTTSTALDGDRYALALEGVTVAFGARTILHDTDLLIEPGEFVALVGGNGAGKSTLLRVAAGFVVPDTGRVAIAGEDCTTLRPDERAAVGLAFVSGARPVFPDLTVIENLRVAAFTTHRTARSFATATAAVLDLVPALARRRDHTVGVLSGGEQRLLAVAQTLYRRPIALLADELTLGLDIEARHNVLDLLRVLADDGVAVVAVDHDLAALLPRTDRAALVADGTITDYDEPMRVFDLRADLLPATFLAGVAT